MAGQFLRRGQLHIDTHVLRAAFAVNKKHMEILDQVEEVQSSTAECFLHSSSSFVHSQDNLADRLSRILFSSFQLVHTLLPICD